MRSGKSSSVRLPTLKETVAAIGLMQYARGKIKIQDRKGLERVRLRMLRGHSSADRRRGHTRTAQRSRMGELPACQKGTVDFFARNTKNLGSPKRIGQLTHRLFRRKAGQREPLFLLCVGISWRRRLRVLVRRIHALSGDQVPVFWMHPDFRPIFLGPSRSRCHTGCKFFVVDGDGLYHLNAPIALEHSTSMSLGT
jgi:hypothetical protein